jgi:hypothetical protein
MPQENYPTSKRIVELTTYTIGQCIGMACPACGEILDIQQPNPDDPDRLLAICCNCGAWHIVDPSENQMMLMPS